ncbi:hypothetical protein DV736_g3660, partial [Chaetothyriales sp. CBS 134916]
MPLEVVDFPADQTRLEYGAREEPTAISTTGRQLAIDQTVAAEQSVEHTVTVDQSIERTVTASSVLLPPSPRTPRGPEAAVAVTHGVPRVLTTPRLGPGPEPLSMSGPGSALDKLSQGLAPPKDPPSYVDGAQHALSPAARVPMAIRELEILLALCSTAPRIQRLAEAVQLVTQLSAYLPEAASRRYGPSPYLADIKPSPSAVVTYQLTSALLVLGIRFPSVKAAAAASVQSYLSNWAKSASALSSQRLNGQSGPSEAAARQVAGLAVSLVGFVEAAAGYERFWDVSERLQLIRTVNDALSDNVLIAVETAISVIRHSTSASAATREWKKYVRRYAAKGNPLSAMLLQKGFMRLVLACTGTLLGDQYPAGGRDRDRLDQYIGSHRGDGASRMTKAGDQVSADLIDYLTTLISEQMRILDDGSDYLQLSSAWQQRLAFSVKAYALQAYLHCVMLDDDIADPDLLSAWLEDSLASRIQMADAELAAVVLESLAIVAQYIPESASNYARIILRFIVQDSSRPLAVATAAQSLSHVLRLMSQDAVITTLYSLGNILSSQFGAENTHHTIMPSADVNGSASRSSLQSSTKKATPSLISVSISSHEEIALVCGNVARAIVVVAASCHNTKITAIAQTMLLQKVGRINLLVDARIIEESAALAIDGKESEFKALLRLHARLHEEAAKLNNTIILDAVQKARHFLAHNLDNQSSLFRIFVSHLLQAIISQGDVAGGELKQSAEVEQAANQIGPLLNPLSILAQRSISTPAKASVQKDPELAAMVREAWFNIAGHGIYLDSKIGLQHWRELALLALNSNPLVDQDRTELLESDVELNTILRRGMSTQHIADQRRHLASVIPEREPDIKHLSYQKVVFLNAVYLVESLRALSANCVDVLHYFVDPTLLNSALGRCLSAIADDIVKRYTQKVVLAKDEEFSAIYVSGQLAQIFSACCHRSQKMQEVARRSANTIIAQAPSTLIQQPALFALLELLTIMWSACLEEDTDEYEWKAIYSSARAKVTVRLSDDYSLRKLTLNKLYTDARKWVTDIIAIAPLDVKGLLQTYLSEDDTAEFGQVALGRSFALEMGGLVPAHDQRLVTTERANSLNINVASDFVAQYTSRQEYRFTGVAHHGPDHVRAVNPVAEIIQDSEALVAKIHARTHSDGPVQPTEVKDVLRRAAALLCTSKSPQTTIVHYLVTIPFELFTKDSINLAVSLWLGVIHENPRMEPRILTEVAQAWERTIDRKVGIFSPHFRHPDPFYLKEEFAPSDRLALHNQIRHAQDLISPHLRVIQFFQSHFNAARLGSANTQQTFQRLMGRTLRAFIHVNGHPLLRETQFHVVLFGLAMIRYGTCFNKTSLWTFKDEILSAGLHWFTLPPSWSFGGNRVQVKAEVQTMRDVLAALDAAKAIGASTSANRKDTDQKQHLLEALLNSEISRLNVWLYPTAHGHNTSHHGQIQNLTRTAWAESPALAIQLVPRYTSLDTIRRDVRFLLSNFPQKALDDPYAVDLLLGDSLASDLSFQLRYLLYWSPVGPMQAVSYFLPSYHNNPFVLQYAIRALESHSIDVTFFYVPQIVQCLRYDDLGYVERYIVETGAFSQLFAHQIIWNMKANAYKDDDGTIPDDIKPTLDKAMDKLITSFTGEDKAFYEREFDFFGKVTDISGKLKPYIKKSKPEKKQKIEEELRKIQVDVGVYLPSNPDGVVVGIDRKSGKPLQSHAKAPYMATFRIRKQREPGSAAALASADTVVIEPEKGRSSLRAVQRRSASSRPGSVVVDVPPANSYDIWQSAIFKVGDDCRQDILALQMIAAFRGIFNSVGLDVYVYPYRVTATAPGCGVIDVLPNSISRDMIGRESVNALHDYFITKYGGEHSVRYQEARSEFVKSMAAYSVISYLLQFKDRHNGNIMVDDKGHILHIDFGFCFDVSPGGVRFERAPFKLVDEMIAVLGGNETAADGGPSQSYRWFQELTVKAFLCSRQYYKRLAHLVSLMLESGLPCFRPETMDNFRNRFRLELGDREAARFMLDCISKSERNVSTKVYDEFQLLTNGIPY